MQAQSSASSQSGLPADFAFTTIGKPPSLLKRLTDFPLDIDDRRSQSRSPSPSLETNKVSASTQSPASSGRKLSERLGIVDIPQTTVDSNLSGFTISPAPNHIATAVVVNQGRSDPDIPEHKSPVSMALPTKPPVISSSAVSASHQPGTLVASKSNVQASNFSASASNVTGSVPPMDVDFSPSVPATLPQFQSQPFPPPTMPHITAEDLYTKLKSLASERTAWDDIIHHFQRCRDEQEELLRRNEETARAARREKEQADRVLAAAEAAFKLVESLRDTQKQRWQQEKIFAEHAYAETLRLQHQGSFQGDTGSVVSVSTMPAVPVAHASSGHLPAQAQVSPATSAAAGMVISTPIDSVINRPAQPAVPSIPVAPRSTTAILPAVSQPVQTKESVVPTAPRRTGAGATTQPTLQPIASQTNIPAKSAGAQPQPSPSHLPRETVEERQRREELERLQAEKKAQIQARKRKEQAEESARIRATRAHGTAISSEAGVAQSASATPNPPAAVSQKQQDAVLPNKQSITASTSSTSLATRLAPTVQVQKPTQVTVPSAPSSSGTGQGQNIITPTATKGKQGEPRLTIATNVTPATTSKSPVEVKTPSSGSAISSTSVARAGLANLPPKPCLKMPPVEKNPSIAAPMAKPTSRPPTAPKSEAAPASLVITVKQELPADIPLSFPKVALSQAQAPEPRQSVVAPPHTSVAPATPPDAAAPQQSQRSHSKVVTQANAEFNVRDRDRSGRISDNSVSATSSRSTVDLSAQDTTRDTLKPVSSQQVPPPQQYQRQNESGLTRTVNSSIAEQVRPPPPPISRASFDADPWSMDPRVESEKSRSAERSPSPPSQRRLSYDHYSPQRPGYDHYSPEKPSLPLSRATARRGRGDHYSPPRSPSLERRPYSPTVEVGRKRLRDGDTDWAANEQPARRTKVSGPLPTRSLDWSSSHYRQEISDARDMARTPPRDDYPRAPAPPVRYHQESNPESIYGWSGAPSDVGGQYANKHEQYAYEPYSRSTYDIPPHIGPITDGMYTTSEHRRDVSGGSQGAQNRPPPAPSRSGDPYRAQQGTEPAQQQQEPGLLIRMSEPKPPAKQNQVNSRARGADSAASGGRGGRSRGSGARRARGGNAQQTDRGTNRSLSSRMNNSLEARLSG